MIFKRYIVLLFFIISCNSKNSNDFSILKSAFIDWYHKNHITERFNYDLSYFNINDLIKNDDNIEDINRFELELSQINKNNLRYQHRIDYDNLLSIINRLHLNKNKNDYLQTDVNVAIINIFKSLFDIINNKNKTDFEKIIILNNHIKDIIKYLSNVKESLVLIKSDSFIKEFNNNFNILVKYIEYVEQFYFVNEDNYKHLNDSFKLLKNKLSKYSDWVNYDLNPSSQIVDTNNRLDHYKLYINNLFNNDYYNYDSIFRFLSNKKKILYDDIFDDCLIIYLNYNDEPVWVDNSDTVNVINWVINNKIKVNNFSKNLLINNIDKNYKKIVDYYNEDKIDKFDASFVKIRNSNDYEIIEDYLYNNGDFIINNNFYSSNFYDDYLISLIFEKIFTFHNLHRSLSSNNNQLRNIKNDFYLNGISFFMYDLYVNDIKDDFSSSKIFFNLELLKKIETVILQDSYRENSNKKALMFGLETNKFLSKSELKDIFTNAFESEKYYLGELLTYFHLLHLYEKECLLNNKYTKSEFLGKIFNYGYVNYYTIN